MKILKSLLLIHVMMLIAAAQQDHPVHRASLPDAGDSPAGRRLTP